MRSLLLFLTYSVGLLVLVVTKHRDSVRIGLVRFGLLRLDATGADASLCQAVIPFTRGMRLYAGQGLRSCTGQCEMCDPHYLVMHESGKLALYRGKC